MESEVYNIIVYQSCFVLYGEQVCNQKKLLKTHKIQKWIVNRFLLFYLSFILMYAVLLFLCNVVNSFPTIFSQKMQGIKKEISILIHF